MKIFASLFLAVFVLVSVAFAAETSEETPRFRSYVKQVKCGAIIKDIESQNTKQGMALIVSSFISGSNYAKQRVSRIDFKGMMLLTEQFCRQNPEAPILQALVSLDRKIDRVDSRKDK